MKSLGPSLRVFSLLIGITAPAILTVLFPFLATQHSYIAGTSAGVFAIIGTLAMAKPQSILSTFLMYSVRMQTAWFALVDLSLLLHVMWIWRSVWHFGHATGAVGGATVFINISDS